MARMTPITCPMCGEAAEKPAGEVRRSTRLGRSVFCGRRCSAKAANAKRKAKIFSMLCPCGEEFETSTHNKAKRHCSRSCASYYSMSPGRREAVSEAGKANQENLISPQEVLKIREAWKYVALKTVLEERPHEFEFKLGKFIYDLALFDVKTLVEFDGPDHCGKTAKKDAKKERAALRAGWRLERRAVRAAEIIHPTTIEGL